MVKSKIPYCDVTWNLTGGCTHCSPGCLYCWSENLVATRFKDKSRYDGLTKDGKWTGKIELFIDRLNQSFNGESKRIFVCSQSDLFHPKVNIGFLTHVFDTIKQCPQHTFLILTKRPKQALKMMWGKHGEGWRYFGDGDFHKNIHFGISICTQKEADEKIPIFLQIPAAVWWISFEPLLEYIELPEMLPGHYWYDWEKGCLIKQIVVGCESGPKRRPCKLEWVKSIIEQCKAANVKIFVKQLDLDGKVERDMNKFPEWARIREYPQ